MRGLLAYRLPAACGCQSLRRPDRGLAQRVVPVHRAIWARPLSSTGLVLICGRQRAQDAGCAGAHAPNSLWSLFAAQAPEGSVRCFAEIPGTETRQVSAPPVSSVGL